MGCQPLHSSGTRYSSHGATKTHCWAGDGNCGSLLGSLHKPERALRCFSLLSCQKDDSKSKCKYLVMVWLMVCSRQHHNGLVKNILLIALIALNKNINYFFFYLHSYYSMYFFFPCWCWEVIQKQECWQVGVLGIPNIEISVSERHCWKVVAFHTFLY